MRTTDERTIFTINFTIAIAILELELTNHLLWFQLFFTAYTIRQCKDNISSSRE